MEVTVMCQGVITLENKHMQLVFEGDGGSWLMGSNGGGSWWQWWYVVCLRHDETINDRQKQLRL